jgi:hypothetical protein
MLPRLIDVNTLRLVKPRDHVEYAILSHRWLEPNSDEVTYEDMQALSEAQKKKKGFDKIAQCCRLARERNLDYIWSDTCCIDKSNNTEYQASINSMYSWYRDASVCIAYLGLTSTVANLGQDEWFTRGWTLQELIAPTNVEFYSASWGYLGSKDGLKDEIHAATGIDLTLLRNSDMLRQLSVAQRMSWAANRKLTVPEDQAYCLFGIFDVNMPLLYGEGAERAFGRLQEEIIKTSDDHSIFAWRGITNENPGLLATKTRQFQGCGSVKNAISRRGRSAFAMTNRGVSITLNLTQWTLDTYVARVHFADLTSREGEPVESEEPETGIFLRRLEEDNQYARVAVARQEFVQLSRVGGQTRNAQQQGRDLPIFIRQAALRPSELRSELSFGCAPERILDHTFEREYGFRLCEDLIELDKTGKPTITLLGANKGIKWNARERTLTTDAGSIRSDTLCILNISNQGKKIKYIKLCFDFGFNPVIFLAESSAFDRKERLFNKEGKFNINSDWQYTELEVQGAKSLLERSAHDKLGWSSTSTTRAKSGARVASQSPIRSGLWALRIDRVDGLDVVLEGTEIRVIVRKVNVNRGNKQGVEEPSGLAAAGRLIWDLQIENMPGSSGKLFRNIFS